MIALLAKLDPGKLKFLPEKLEKRSESNSDIQIVIAEGLQVAVPMAGVCIALILHGLVPALSYGFW